jgi:DNA-directed RNA polymerase sigma subunit (sigma70/sigma32)
MTTLDTRLRGEGMTIRQIARVLRISPARVRQLENQALEKLRAYPGLLREFINFDTTSRAREGSHR